MTSVRTMALTILCLFGFLTFSQAGVFKFDPRIVNGEDAKKGEIPYQVSLQRLNNFHFCGGSVWNKKYVITAAHCVEGETAGQIQVIANSIDLDNPNAIHYVTNIIIHESYNASDSWINDIALLKVNPFFTEKQYVPYPSENDQIATGSIARISGWGRLWDGGPTTNLLQKADIYISDQKYCCFVYDYVELNVREEQICAFDPRVERGMCNGDSGGPLTVGGKLVGLVSWSIGCGDTFFPGVFTRVVKYLDWIKFNAI